MRTPASKYLSRTPSITLRFVSALIIARSPCSYPAPLPDADVSSASAESREPAPLWVVEEAVAEEAGVEIAALTFNPQAEADYGVGPWMVEVEVAEVVAED